MLYTAAKFLPLLIHCLVGVPITNGGFETDDYPIPNNTFRYYSHVVTGWNIYDPNNVTAEWSEGIENPTNGDSYNDTIFESSAPEGIQILYLEPDGHGEGNGEFGIEQTLPQYTVSADTTYILTVYVGNPGNNCWYKLSTGGAAGCTGKRELGFAGYKTVLLANHTIIAQDDNTLIIPEKEWRLSHTEVTILTGDPNIGIAPLKIRLLHKNSAKDIGFQVDFDDVQLSMINITSAPTDEPTMDTEIITTFAAANNGNIYIIIIIIIVGCLNIIVLIYCVYGVISRRNISVLQVHEIAQGAMKSDELEPDSINAVVNDVFEGNNDEFEPGSIDAVANIEFEENNDDFEPGSIDAVANNELEENDDEFEPGSINVVVNDALKGNNDEERNEMGL